MGSACRGSNTCVLEEQCCNIETQAVIQYKCIDRSARSQAGFAWLHVHVRSRACLLRRSRACLLRGSPAGIFESSGLIAVVNQSFARALSKEDRHCHRQAGAACVPNCLWGSSRRQRCPERSVWRAVPPARRDTRVGTTQA